MQQNDHASHESTGLPPTFHPTNETFRYLYNRQLGNFQANPRKLVESHVAKQLPGLLKQKEYDLGKINKIFAAEWLSDRQVAFGTKCNKVCTYVRFLNLHLSEF